MNIRQRWCVLVACALAVMTSAEAQDFSKAGTSAAQFLKIPVGARAASLASTFGSIADDISTLYWNPAGAAALRQFEIGVSHSRWIADIDHDFLGIALPLGEHATVGVSVLQLNSGDIEVTTIDEPKGTGTFYSARDLAFAVTYSQYLIEQVSVGASAKYVTQRLANSSAQTVAFDFGVVLHTGFHEMKVGLSFQHFGPGLTLSGSDMIQPVDLDPVSTINPPAEADLTTQPFGLPTSYRASVSMPLIGRNAPVVLEDWTLLVAGDAVHLNDNREHFSLGAECGFAGTLYLRAGYTFNTDEEGLSLGGGVKVDVVSSTVYVDYGYVAFGVFDAVHMFTFGIRL